MQLARSYVETAYAATLSPQRGRHHNDIYFIYPTFMLIGHAIELYLKAWLTYRGYSKEQLQKYPFGHNIQRLCTASRSEGMPEPTESVGTPVDDLVKWFGPEHSEYNYRYPDSRQTEIWELPAVFSALSAWDDVLTRYAHSAGYEGLKHRGWTVDESLDFRGPRRD